MTVQRSSCTKALLQNAEICHRICSYATRGTLSRLARVSKSWEDCANSVLWHELPSLQPLLQLVTPKLWSGMVVACYKTKDDHKGKRCQGAAAAMSPEKWLNIIESMNARPRTLGKLVRRLTIDPRELLTVPPYALAKDIHAPRGCRGGLPDSLLPCVRQLIIMGSPAPDLQHALNAWPRLFPDLIDTVMVLRATPEVVHTVLQSLRALEHFCIQGTEDLSSPLASMPRAPAVIFDLDLTAPYSKAGIEGLAQVEKLEKLSIVILGSAMDGLPRIRKGGFCKLRYLEVTFEQPEFPSVRISQTIIDSLDHPWLQSIILKDIGSTTGDEIHDLLIAIKRSCDPQALKTLVIERRKGVLPSYIDWSLGMSQLSLLADFGGLEMLALDVSRGVALTLKECEAVAEWWPKLHTLRLSSTFSNAHRTRTSLACAAALANQLTGLRILALVVHSRDTRWSRQPADSTKFNSPCLTTLDVGDSPIHPDSAEQVAGFLKTAFPRLSRLLHSSTDAQQSNAWNAVARKVTLPTASGDVKADVRRIAAVKPASARSGTATSTPTIKAVKVEKNEQKRSHNATTSSSRNPPPTATTSSPESTSVSSAHLPQRRDSALTASSSSAPRMAQLELKVEQDEGKTELEQRHAELQRQHAKLGRRYETLDARFEVKTQDMQLRIDELVAQKGHLARAHAELEDQSEKQLKRVLELERQREELSQAPTASSVASGSGLAQKLAAAERAKDSLAAQRTHLVETHAAMEGRFEKLHDLGRRFEELSRTSAPSAVSSDAGLAEKLAATERANDELAAQKDHLTRAHAALEDQSEKQQKHILELQRRLEELSQAPGPSSAAVNLELVQKLKEAGQERDKLQARHNALLKHSQRVVAEKQAAEQQKRLLEELNEQLRHRCRELEQWQTNMQRDLHALTHRSGALPTRGLSS